MFDADPSLEDADVAAALYELGAPDLPPPTCVRLEPTRDAEIRVWTIQAKGVALRMKVAATELSAARLRRGARLLPLLATRGVRVPEPLRVVERPGGAPVTVALERRLGTANAAVGWPILGAPGRIAFAEALARALLALHASAGAWQTLASSPASPATIPWRAEIETRIGRSVALLREADVVAPEVANRVAERLLAAARNLPERIEPALCHGAFALSAASLERRVFAGLSDLESACLADRWFDVTAVVAALSTRADAATRRFLEVYGSVVPLPADLAARVDLYAGLVLLRMTSRAAATHASEDRSMVRELVEAWIETEPSPLS